ncbi:MAG: hypothetical protein KH208_04850 [Desulfovibrio sp.]|uniref:hypothetical protein n=1 Tax=Desulfovibrio sp. TaxID=885 RepID=UPI0025C23298|nr:hypothetical protein [Desulfovibrio sp.]MBS6829191.1 hypothetical protein [Desulfovibrio sp.]
MSYDKIVNPELNFSLDHDFGGMSFFSKDFLCAVANGKVDMQAMMEFELAARGYDKDGNWIGLSTRTNPVLVKYARKEARA